MKLIIDISEDKYRQIKDLPNAFNSDICQAIRNGKPYEERPQGDFISREALKKDIERTFDMQDLYLPVHFLDLIDNAPTVEERPHGKWIDPKNVGANNWCSVCGEFILHYNGICNYCSNCGAKMKGGAE